MDVGIFKTGWKQRLDDVEERCAAHAALGTQPNKMPLWHHGVKDALSKLNERSST